MSRPSIDQLVQILDSEEEVEIEILPNVKCGPKMLLHQRTWWQKAADDARGSRRRVRRWWVAYGHHAHPLGVVQAAQYFAYVEAHPTTGGGVFVKAAFQNRLQERTSRRCS